MNESRFKIGRISALGISIFLVFLYSFTVGLHENIFGGEFNGIILLVIAMCIIYKCAKIKKIELKKHDAWILLLIVIMLANNQDNKSFGRLVVNSEFYMIIWMIYLAWRRYDDWHEAFFKVVMVFGIFHAAVTWITFFSPAFYKGVIAPLFPNTSVLNQYNQGWMPGLSPHYSTNGIYLGIGSCVAAAVIITKNKKKFKDYLIFLLIASALLLTGKRSPSIAVLAGFIVVYYVYNCDRKLSRYFKILCALFFIGIVFYFAAQFVPNLANIITRFQSTAETGDITVGRADRYAKVWELFLDHPFFGIGWNGTVYYFRNIEDLAINAHNIYLQLLCETGVIGSVFYFLFFGYTLFCAITTLQQARKRIIILNSEQTCMLSLSLYLQMFFLFYGITGNPLYDSQALFPYLAAAAIANYYRCNYAIVKKKR